MMCLEAILGKKSSGYANKLFFSMVSEWVKL